MKRRIKKLIKTILPRIYKKVKYSYIDNSDLDRLLEHRTLEPELFLLKNHIDKNSICFDVGANSGEYIYQFEKIVGVNNIFAFEPIPELYSNLKLAFRNLNLYKIALSDNDNVKKFKIPKIEGKTFETRGKLNIELIEPGESDFDIIDVQCQSLDSFVECNNIKTIDFIKIDVEGHEFNVLKGAVESIKIFKPTILIEIEQRHHDYPIRIIFEFVRKLGYDIKYYSLETKQYLEVDIINIYEFQDYSKIKSSLYINNFWCLPV